MRSPTGSARSSSLVLASIAGILLAGCATPAESSPPRECPEPGEAGPGYVRFSYYVRATPPEGVGVTLRVPVVVDGSTGALAAVMDCLKLDRGQARWGIVEEPGRGTFLEYRSDGGESQVRGVVLVDRYSEAAVEERNWTLAPLERQLTRVPRPPPDAGQNAFPLGETQLEAGTTDIVVRVYFARDWSADDITTHHRQDMLEVRSKAGWQSAVVFRASQTLR